MGRDHSGADSSQPANGSDWRDHHADVRGEIVRIGYRMWQRGMVAANDGNISVLLDGGAVLCTPTSVSKGALREEDLVVVDQDGNVLDPGSGRGPSSEILMHLRVYQVDPQIRAVVHAHPPYATAFAVRGETPATDILPESVVALPVLPLAPYATPSTIEVPDSVEPLVRRGRACLLEHHGALTWGVTLEEAYLAMERVEYLAQINLIARQLGGIRSLGPERIGQLHQQFNVRETP